MPSSIPTDLEGTPDQQPWLGDHLPATRGEMRAISRDVKFIKQALVGDNPMNPDPLAIVGRVDAHHDRIKTLENSSTEARWGYRAGIGGIIGVIIHRIFSGH